jgi:hypothetical protein
MSSKPSCSSSDPRPSFAQLVTQAVFGADARRYAVELCRHADREEAARAAAIAARNQALADVAEVVVRAGRPPMPHFDLIPRLIAHDAHRDPLPPDPWESVLRADLRFVIWRHDVFLADRSVSPARSR